MSLHVLDPGLASRVVDLGRPATRNLGVPVGGAADRAALALANALVGNPPDAAALEVCMKGPVLRAETWLGCALFGAPFSLASARQPLAACTSFTLEPGEEIHIGGTGQGMRAYLAVRGAFLSPAILGSCSGLDMVRMDENLPCRESFVRRRFFPPAVRAELAHDRLVLRTLSGIQAAWFDERSLYDQEFVVTPALNRMGMRLKGQPLPVPAGELVSEPVCPGAVQVTRDGQCIVLGVDGQTIGGYPKVAQVIQADLDHLGQLRPGAAIRFRKVALAEAETLFRRRQAFVSEWCMRARVSLDCW